MPAPVDAEERRLVDALTASADPKGAAEALASLMARYKRLAYAVALDTQRDSSLADDVFQETFVRMAVWLRARPGIEVRSFSRLLCAFVRRTALELARKGPAAQPTGSVERWIESSLVDRIYAKELLESFPAPTRRILELTLVAGMSSREVADEMDLAAGHVRQIKHRALRAIRRQQSHDLASIASGSSLP
jgi:RNA polymerase sigma factor (sigma-70 family)